MTFEKLKKEGTYLGVNYKIVIQPLGENLWGPDLHIIKLSIDGVEFSEGSVTANDIFNNLNKIEDTIKRRIEIVHFGNETDNLNRPIIRALLNLGFEPEQEI